MGAIVAIGVAALAATAMLVHYAKPELFNQLFSAFNTSAEGSNNLPNTLSTSHSASGLNNANLAKQLGGATKENDEATSLRPNTRLRSQSEPTLGASREKIGQRLFDSLRETEQLAGANDPIKLDPVELNI